MPATAPDMLIELKPPLPTPGQERRLLEAGWVHPPMPYRPGWVHPAWWLKPGFNAKSVYEAFTTTEALQLSRLQGLLSVRPPANRGRF